MENQGLCGRDDEPESRKVELWVKGSPEIRTGVGRSREWGGGMAVTVWPTQGMLKDC